LQSIIENNYLSGRKFSTLNGGAAATASYTYDDLSRVKSSSYGNGTSENNILINTIE
jgi:hypothetical protein